MVIPDIRDVVGENQLVLGVGRRLLPGYTKLESTVRYLGIEVDDFLQPAEQTDV